MSNLEKTLVSDSLAVQTGAPFHILQTNKDHISYKRTCVRFQ